MSKQIFPSSVNCSSKLIEPEQGVVGTSDLQPSEVRVTTWTCDWHPELEGVVGTSSLQPVGKKHR